MRIPMLAFAALLGAALAAAEAPSLTNGGFEPPFDVLEMGKQDPNGAVIIGRLAHGWSDNSSWAKLAVSYEIEDGDPHRGKTAQAVALTRFTDGALQLVQAVPFRAGQGLRFSVWLRGRAGQSVELLLRQQDAPWGTYATTRCQLSAEWQQFRVQGVMPVDETGLVMIKANEPMRFLIDDATVEDLKSLSSALPRREGNQVPGGSFETRGMPVGWSIRQQGDPDWVWRDRRYASDVGGVHGQRSLRIDLQPGGSADVNSPVLHPIGNRAHAISAWLRADRPGVKVHLLLRETPVETWAEVDTGWRRVTASGTVPFLDWSQLRLVVHGPPDQAATVWIDGAMLEEASEASPAYRAESPLELALAMDRPGHVVHDDAPATATIAIAPAPPASATLHRELVDLLGETHALPPLALPVTELTLPDPPGRSRGMFKLRVQVRTADGEPLSAPAELAWARLPAPRELDPTTSAFGLHIPLAPRYIALARAIGQRWIRFHDTCMIAKWPIAEPEPGVWRFYDEQVSAAHDGGLAILGMLDGAPARVSSVRREGGYWSIWHLPDLPGADAEWRRYVTTVVEHYRGRIDHWEVWNEPWGEWWRGAGGTPEAYAALMRGAYEAAKAASPQVTVVGVDSYRGKGWHEPVLEASGTDCFDVFSFHDYNDALYGGDPSFAQIQANTFNAVQRAFGGEAKPLWNTEGGIFGVGSWYAPETGGMPARSQVAYAIRYDVCMLAAGVERSFLYAVHTDPRMGSIETRTDEYDQAIKPILAARAVLAAHVDGLGRPLRVEAPQGVDRYRFPQDPANSGRVVELWWTHDGSVQKLPQPPGATVLDALGCPLPAAAEIRVDQEPVFVLLPGG